MLWPLLLDDRELWIAALSMGNPHAVQLVDDVDAAPVASDGPQIETHARFPQRVNAGFMQIVDRTRRAPARVGTRRRRDAGLRHRRVRRSRRRHPPRSAAVTGRGIDSRRYADDCVGRWAGLDDRSGDSKVFEGEIDL